MNFIFNALIYHTSKKIINFVETSESNMKKALQYLLIVFAITAPIVFTSCDKDDWWDNNDYLYGLWAMNGYDPEYGSYTYSMNFRRNGICTITEIYDYYPQFNASYDVEYYVSGSIYHGAILEIWGYYPEGQYFENVYQVFSDNGYTLNLDGVEGDCAGSYLILDRY